MRKSLLVLSFLLFSLVCLADEGMWLVHLLRQEQMRKMHSMGLTLSADQIYSESKASLKDAIVAIDHGQCTGSMISSDGLMITNFHCALDDVQSISSLENNYLRDGYHADEEVSMPSKSVSFLIKVVDVTSRVKSLLKIYSYRKAKHLITSEFSSNTIYDLDIEYMNVEGKYLLFYYQTFKDVRLVFAPPRSVADFGGDSDNFSWPQHKCDFAIYRVYGDADGRPAAYSLDNIPIKPKYVIPIAKHSPKAGDFTILLGYPYSTNRYLSSYGVEYVSKRNDLVIKSRKPVVDVLKYEMSRDEALSLKYSPVFFDYANVYKNLLGENEFINKYKLVDKRRFCELNNDLLMSKIHACYDSMYRYQSILDYNVEVFAKGSNLFKYSFSLPSLSKAMRGHACRDSILIDRLVDSYHSIFDDYSPSIDRRIAVSLMSTYLHSVDSSSLPSYIRHLCSTYDCDVQLIIDDLFDETSLLDINHFLSLVDSRDYTSIENDPLYIFISSIIECNRRCKRHLRIYNKLLSKLHKLYIESCYTNQADSYSDANSTMRLTYGRVGGYSPSDSLSYSYASSIGGLKDKMLLSKSDYRIDNESAYNTLMSLNDSLQTAFISDIDIVAGNSGSPVLNGNGELVGLAYDGCWDALAGSLYYHPTLNRAVCLDIAYIRSFCPFLN